MATSRLLERRARAARLPERAQRRRELRRRAVLAGRRALALLAVTAATLFGALLALTSYSQLERLSVGEVALSVDPGHKGALDLYVPLVDWGVRFEAIRLPVRLNADLRTVDRKVVQKVADGGFLDVHAVRAEARDAVASYLRALIALTVVCALALGLLVALAIRSRAGPRLRWTAGLATLLSVGIGVALVVLIPPRGSFDDPQYFAHGPDIPRALQAVEDVQRSSGVLDQELDAQLVGLARLVTEPANRRPIAGQPHLTVASDLHNNVLALPILQRVAAGGPVFFPGDLTDRGSPVETRLVRQIVGSGNPFVFVTGNHDSDSLVSALVKRGAIVLSEHGRLLKDGGYGPVINQIGGLRVAGYSDPFERLSAQNYKDRYHPVPTPEQQDAFTNWLRPLIGKIDVVMVHEPQLIAPALAMLRDEPPSRPLVFLVGHTHKAAIERFAGVTVLNDGSIGAGGTGNLADHPTDLSLARLIYTSKPAFQPLAADMVSIDPGSGSSTARRERLDVGPRPIAR